MCKRCASYSPGAEGLTADRCDMMLRETGGKMWQMLAREGRSYRKRHELACFDGIPHFFEDLVDGVGCDRNWFEGGVEGQGPAFSAPAPALLGIDDKALFAFCSASLGLAEGPYYEDSYEDQPKLAERCIAANENLLRVGRDWSFCTTMRWQVCAAQGRLPRQGSRLLHFAVAPHDLNVAMFRDGASGASSRHHVGAYEKSDIYFLQVCLLAQICRNADELFRLYPGQLFSCDVVEDAIYELADIL